MEQDKVYNVDCLEGLKQLDDNSIDTIVTDPPYGINFMGKEWDKFNEIVSPQGAYENKKGFRKLPRHSTIAMTEFFVPIWRECLRVLKSGAFAFVMCSPRQDVMMKQIESLQKAGFNTGFTSIYWTFASGFPKSMNIGKAIDKKLGAERNVVGKKRGKVDFSKTVDGDKSFYDNAWQNNEYVDLDITTSSTPQAKALDGSYAGYQPKPALELILVCMKPPSEKTYVDQALKNAKGVTWLDNCRVPFENKDDVWEETDRGGFNVYDFSKDNWGAGDHCAPPQKGRFPANLLVSDDALNDGKVTASEGGKTTRDTAFFGGGTFHMHGYGDAGSFSRYFSLDSWFAERIKHLPADVQKVFPFLIVPKASKSEKNKGLDNIDSKQTTDGRKKDADYPSQRGITMRHNHHPTCKPIKLMSYLIILGSRPNDVVLDPFIGSGTTGLAARMSNRHYIGFEISEEYCEIANARLKSIPVSLDSFFGGQ